MSKWHFGPPTIPVTIVGVSLAALAIPMLAVLIAGDEALRFEALLWLVALIPAFLLAYYRGWHGVATGLAAGMAVFSLVQVYLVLTGSRLPDWPFMLSVIGVFVVVTLFLGAVTERVHMEREKAERLALYDVLTGLPNRRYFELLLEREFAAARRGRPIMVVAFDLDRLKDVNDRHGHSAGDEMLRAFAHVLEANTRTMDLSARLGGDEFMTILSQSNPDGAGVFARRVRDAAERTEGLPGTLRVSVGMAAWSPEMAEAAALVRAADQALYEAKAERDQAGPPTSSRATPSGVPLDGAR